MPRFLLLGLLFGLPIFAETISVAFPAERQRLPFVKETHVIGAVEPGRTEILYLNGVTTAVHRTGAFIQMLPVVPGTNTLTVCRGGARLVRRFVVAEEDVPSPKVPPTVTSDDSPLLGEPRAWRTTGTLFANRVRSTIEGGDSLFFLPRDFTVRGAEVKGTSWVAVWMENELGFLPRRQLVEVKESGKLPPKGLIVPDIRNGFPEAPPRGRDPSSVCVYVDAGHGGSDPGSLSPHGWYEKDVNLMQARAIRDALERAGFRVVMTRDGDSFPTLLQRPQAAYDGRAHAFISVHHNATAPHRDPREARHTVAYASCSNGLDLARCVQKHIAQVMAPVPDAGAQMKSLAVCRNPAVPSCLLEVDFINLPEGEEASWNSMRQKKIADAVVCGVLDWMAPPVKAETAE